MLAIALLVIAASVEAKGPTVKLTLTGPGLARAIEITEAGLLDGSNVWAGAFIGETAAAALVVNGPIYTVAFDVSDTQDGHWHRPSLAWAAAIAKYVP
ncbi:MAG TPA: hypothetical protein VNN99_15595 [Vicinamibacterales bacterium]|nr:hypothetical protein [Vicinamibacterales bacterium]